MSLTTLTLLTEGTVWQGLKPRWFQCTFSEDTSIARVDFYNASGVVLETLLNVASDTAYPVIINEDLHKIIFIPDSVEVETRLRITNIRWDMQYLLVYDPDKVVVFYEDGRQVEPLLVVLSTGGTEDLFESITFTNGVGTGFANLVAGSMLGLAVFSKGSLLGYVTANTSTTVTLSTEYSSFGPITIWFTYPFGSRILATASVNEYLLPPTPFTTEASAHIYTAPPWPIAVEAGATERLSNMPVSEYVSVCVAQTGLNFSM